MIWLAILYAITSSAFAQLGEVDFCRIPGNCTVDEDDCFDYSNCISQYEALESYLLHNDDTLTNLTKGFYKTGADSAEFVKIVYHYQVPNGTDEYNSTCFAQRSVYFWATSPSFLLGPKPMLWFSLFAINPVQSSVILELPCLQGHFEELLSRLTYLIKVYAVTRYDDQGLQFANKFYFKARIRDERPSSANNYDYIVSILTLTVFLPIGTFPLAGLIGHKLISFSLSKYAKNPFLGKYAVLVKYILGVMSPILSLAFLSFHILAMVRLHEYFSEIVLDSPTTDEANTETEDAIVAMHSIFSFIPLLVAIGALCYYVCEKEELNTVNALLIFNIIYLAYFIPYMIMAFISNPIQTIFVYLVLLIFAAFIPLMLFIGTGLKDHYTSKNKDEDEDVGIVFGLMGLSIGYYLICLIFLFAIGGFNNFHDLQNLFWLVFGTTLTVVGGRILKKMQTREKKKDQNPMDVLY